MSLKEPNNGRLKVMVVNDEEDILRLYSDYLSRKGHQVLKTYLTADDVMEDVERERPNIYLIDHRLHGTKDGIDLAVEILDKYPLSPILFITANEFLESELSKHRIFDGKKLKVLVKPVRLHEIEEHMLDLVKNEPPYARS
ncbi:MAG: response regulator [Nitrososphaerota archaeon]